MAAYFRLIVPATAHQPPSNDRKRRCNREMRARLSAEQNHHCCYCGIRTEILERSGMDGKPPSWHATIEHIHARRRGCGRRRDRWSNLAMACYGCNNLRGNRDALAFYESREWEAAQASKPRASFPAWVRDLALPWPKMVDVWPQAVGR